LGLIDKIFSGTSLASFVSHRNLYLLGLVGIMCGLAWSHALLSIGQFVLLGNALLELDFKLKWKRLKSQPLFWVLIGLFLLHLLSILWSTNLDYWFKDLRNKLPLIVLPLIIASSKPIQKQEWSLLIKVYLLTLFILSGFSLNRLLSDAFLDKRELAINISHIRYGLNICFGIVLLAYSNINLKPWLRLTLALWFLICLFIFQLYTGLIIALLIMVLSIVRYFFIKKRLIPRLLILFSFLAIIVASIFWLKSVYSTYAAEVPTSYDQELPKKQNIIGSRFYHKMDDKQSTNGVYIWRYIAYKELYKAWNKRSKIDVKGKDKKGQSIASTLIRYLSSKGLTKDSLGVSKLSERDIKAIEEGVANYKYLDQNKVENRIHDVWYEIEMYRDHGYASGYSMVMRWIYWKTAFKIISKNIWFGVGSGDVNDLFLAQYVADESSLEMEYRRRSHNQYLAIWVGLGLFGLLYFLFSLIFPLWHIPKGRDVIYVAFFAIACLSFLTEDTLETQAGVTFFAAFNSLILLGLRDQDHTSR